MKMWKRVVVCPKCKKAQITMANKFFKCKDCGYTTKLEKVRVWYITENGREARAYLLKLKEVLRNKGFEVR